MKIIEPKIEFVWITPNPEKTIELAGRTCYQSKHRITENSAPDFCERMVRSGHHAMIEFASACYIITCDRGVTHEIVRHRLASYAQESTRYCNYTLNKEGSSEYDGHVKVIEPPFDCGIDNYHESKELWEKTVRFIEGSYDQLVALGNSAQIARSVLPNSLKADISMTCNFREWRHFFTLRRSKAAHPQMREIANMLYADLAPRCPSIFKDLAI